MQTLTLLDPSSGFSPGLKVTPIASVSLPDWSSQSKLDYNHFSVDCAHSPYSVCCVLRALSQRCSHTAHGTTTSFCIVLLMVGFALREVSTRSMHPNPDNMMCTSAYKTVSSTWPIICTLLLPCDQRTAESRLSYKVKAPTSPFLSFCSPSS